MACCTSASVGTISSSCAVIVVVAAVVADGGLDGGSETLEATDGVVFVFADVAVVAVVADEIG